MKRKKLVLVDGKWVERYVDEGPKGAQVGHGAGLRRGAVGPQGIGGGTYSAAKHLA